MNGTKHLYRSDRGSLRSLRPEAATFEEEDASRSSRGDLDLVDLLRGARGFSSMGFCTRNPQDQTCFLAPAFSLPLAVQLHGYEK